MLQCFRYQSKTIGNPFEPGQVLGKFRTNNQLYYLINPFLSFGISLAG